jgi:molecular chaperone DnaJ
MNLSEAYQALNLSENATEEEVKKAFKRQAAKLHPDVNKASDAEVQFKRINEAYQTISDKDNQGDLHWQGGGLNDIFSHFNNMGGFRRSHQQIETVDVQTTISFPESVLGTKKDIKFTRKVKCSSCNGAGETPLPNGCKKCNGKGKITKQQNNMIFIQDCDQCRGKIKKAPCKPCQSQGTAEAEVSLQVAIPGGIINGNILNLQRMGNFVGAFGLMDQFTDAHLHISVVPEAGLTLEGQDVVSTLELSLEEALTGCIKEVKTIINSQNITVPPLSKHKEEIIINNMGVNTMGNQRVILDVKYPADISQLLIALNEISNAVPNDSSSEVN